MGCTSSKPLPSPPVESFVRLTRAAYIDLNPEKVLNGELRIFCSGTHELINLNALQGKYAFCVLENKHVGQAVSQYLLINPLQQEQSNHGCFELFKKKIPGYNHASSRILVGGEITFGSDSDITWNVQSLGYSRFGDFDLNNPNLNTNLAKLWIPGQYKPEHHGKPTQPFFPPQPPTQHTPSAHVTVLPWF